MSDKIKKQRAEELQRLGDNIKAAFSSIGHSAEAAEKGLRRFRAALAEPIKSNLKNHP